MYLLVMITVTDDVHLSICMKALLFSIVMLNSALINRSLANLKTSKSLKRFVPRITLNK